MKLSNSTKKWIQAIIVAILIMCIGLAGCTDSLGHDYHRHRTVTNIKEQPKYFLSIPDSPKIKAWLEMDYISNDTAYFNWYAMPQKTDYQLILNHNKEHTSVVSLTLIDSNRVVSTFTDNKLDSIILNDNQ